MKIPSNVRIKSVNEPRKRPKRSNDSVQIGKQAKKTKLKIAGSNFQYDN